MGFRLTRCLSCGFLGFLSFVLILGGPERLHGSTSESHLWVIGQRIRIQEIGPTTGSSTAQQPPTPTPTMPMDMDRNSSTLLSEPPRKKETRTTAMTGPGFQIGTALSILSILIVGLKIIFCCTIVWRHEPKPKPLIIIHHNKHPRIQQCSVGVSRLRSREEGNLVHLPEEEEEEGEEAPGSGSGSGKSSRSSSGQRSEEVLLRGPQESTTPPPPYSSLGINL